MSRVLVVEDDPATAFGMSQFFSSNGYSVEVAASVQEAMAWLRRKKYTAVFTDWQLSPGGSEGEVVVRMARQHLPQAPVIVVAAAVTQALTERALAAGATRVFAKPVPLGTLLDCLPPASKRRQRGSAPATTKRKKSP